MCYFLLCLVASSSLSCCHAGYLAVFTEADFVAQPYLIINLKADFHLFYFADGKIINEQVR